MRLDRLATLYLANPLRKLSPVADTGCLRILMYHRISAAPEPNFGPYFRVNTSPARFAEHMQFLGEERYKVVDLLHQSLCPFGYLGLGDKESLLFADKRKVFEEVDRKEKIYRKIRSV